MHDDQTRSFTALNSGVTIGQYRLAGRIGAGGMGEVYLAHDTSLDRDVALKFLSLELSRREDARLRFLREAQADARLSHPNIVTIHEVAEHEGRPFFVMEHVQGTALNDFANGRPLPLEQVRELAIQLCDAVSSAHAEGVELVAVDDNGRVRLVDFGLAAVAGVDHLTKSGSTLGTIGYMSPEQVYGQEIDYRSDLFSLGIVLYELLTGKNPFRRNTEAATLHAITHDTPSPPRQERSDIPPEIDSIVVRLLRKEPDKRFRDASEVSAALRTTSGPAPVASQRKDATPSLAVLPFLNLSSDPDQAYFCDGIAEDIISDLNHVAGLRVVARTSAFAFRDHGGDIRDIGRKLGVTHVVEGSVRKSGTRIRIAVQLIEIADGYQLWSERYDRELPDIFAIQDDIAHAIVDKLKLELGKLGAKQRGTQEVPVEAYQLYSRARYEMNLRSAEGLYRALDYLKESIRMAPDYAHARAGLADAYFLLFAYDYMTPRDAIARARTAAQQALELDERLVDAHATMGGLLTYYDWAWSDAEQAFQRALDLSPGHATAHQWYGELLCYLGRSDEAERHLGIALKHDPLSVVAHTMFGWHYVRHREYQRALDYLDRAMALGSASDFTYTLAGWSHFELGNRQEAFACFEQGRAIAGSGAVVLTVEALAHEREGDLQPARVALDALTERAKTQYVSQPYLAALHFILGEEAAAIECLHEALRRRDAELILMSVMPYYNKLHAHPRLGGLLAVLGLPHRT